MGVSGSTFIAIVHLFRSARKLPTICCSSCEVNKFPGLPLSLPPASCWRDWWTGQLLRAGLHTRLISCCIVVGYIGRCDRCSYRFSKSCSLSGRLSSCHHYV